MPHTVLHHLLLFSIKQFIKKSFKDPRPSHLPYFDVSLSVSLFVCSTCSWTQQSRGGRPIALYNDPVSWSWVQIAAGRGWQRTRALYNSIKSAVDVTDMWQEAGEYTKLRHAASTTPWINLGAHLYTWTLGDGCPPGPLRSLERGCSLTLPAACS